VENGLHHGLDGLIVVSAPAALQRERIAARDSMSPAEAEARILSQAPLAEKVACADFVIENGGSLEETRRQVADVWRRVRAGEPR
jgi:dephospho-CoA kinase